MHINFNLVIKLKCSISINLYHFPALIDKNVNELRNNYWPSITQHLFTTIHYNNDNIKYDKLNNNHNKEKDKAETSEIYLENGNPKFNFSLSLISVGIQTIPLNDDYYERFDNKNRSSFNIEWLIARALFQLNGGTGFVLKPVSLRNGKMHYNAGMSKEKTLHNEMHYGPIDLQLEIICAKDIMKLNNRLEVNVIVEIFAAHSNEHYHRFETKLCRTDGKNKLIEIEIVSLLFILDNLSYDHINRIKYRLYFINHV